MRVTGKAEIDITGTVSATGTGSQAIRLTGANSTITLQNGATISSANTPGSCSTGSHATQTACETANGTWTPEVIGTALYLRNAITLTIEEGATITGLIDLDDNVIIIDNRLIRDLIRTTTSAQTIIANQHLTIPTGLSVTISSGSTAAITLSGASATLTNSGTVSTTSPSTAHAVSIAVNGGQVTNSGTISTQGASAHGIYSASSITGVVINHLDGTITTTGAGANAIFLQGGGNGIVTIRDNVSATGTNSYAIHLADTNQLDLELGNGETITGVIQVSGAGVDGSNQARKHSIVVGEGASITANVANVAGISIGGQAIIDIAGEVITQGNASHAIHIGVAGVVLTNRGKIETTGTTGVAHGISTASGVAGAEINHLGGMIASASGIGIFVQGGGNGVVQVRAPINAGTFAAIDLADGNQLDLELGDQETITGRLKLLGAGKDDKDNNDPADDTDRKHSIVVLAGGTITTTKASAHAIDIVADGSVINIAGTVSTTGASSQAIRVTGNNSELTISGNVSAASTNAVAVYLRGTNVTLTIEATATFTGTIDTENTNIIDKRAFTTPQTVSAGNHLTIASTGSITISQGRNPAVTLSVAGTQFTNEGTISTTSSAHAVLISVASITVANSATGTISTTQENAHTISITANNATINNSGRLETAEDNAYGIYSRSRRVQGTLINHLAGIISTQGENAHGIFVESGGNGIVKIRGAISATGAGAFAINLANQNQLDLELGTW